MSGWSRAIQLAPMRDVRLSTCRSAIHYSRRIGIVNVNHPIGRRGERQRPISSNCQPRWAHSTQSYFILSQDSGIPRWGKCRSWPRPHPVMFCRRGSRGPTGLFLSGCRERVHCSDNRDPKSRTVARSWRLDLGAEVAAHRKRKKVGERISLDCSSS